MMKPVSNQRISQGLLVQTFANVTLDVLRIMMYTEARFIGAVGSQSLFLKEYAALLKLSSEEQNIRSEGLVLLSMNYTLSNILASRMLGNPVEEITKAECYDCVSELTNMIAGHSKVYISSKGQSTYNLSIPQIVDGNDPEFIKIYGDYRFWTLSFDVGGLMFYLQLAPLEVIQ